MNMKKTIAAIAAGAVAVSAMATTVSAVESGTLNYNLVNTLQNQPNGKITLKATFPNVKLVAGQEVVIEAVGMAWTDKVVVSGQYIDTNKAINPITFTRDIWSEGYSAATEALISWDGIHIPVKEVNDGSPALIGGAAEATAGTEAVAAVATATYKGFAVATNVETIKANNIDAGTYTLTFQAANGGTPATLPHWEDAGNVEVTDQNIKNTLNALKEAEPSKNTFDIAGTVYTYVPGTDAVPPTTEGFYTGDGKYSAASFGIGKIDGAAAGDTITVVYTAGTDAEAGTDVVMANITVTVSMKGISDKDIEAVNKKIQAGTYGIKFNGVYGDATTSAFTAPTPYKAPFMTQTTDNRNILTYLTYSNVNGSDKGYKNVSAVLNDAIENFETVTFTFNTAAANVRFAVAETKAANGDLWNQPIVTAGPWKEYEKAVATLNAMDGNGNYTFTNRDRCQVIGLYAENDWEGVDTYKAFGDHTYDWFYSPEGTGFTGMDWGGQNLFAGALIVNEGYTMSLSNTEYFDWTKTSISFDWDAIMDGAATTNSYATYIHSLKLATSNLWFWDSMDVVLVAGEADTVDADAAAEVDEDTVDDEEDEIDADEDEDVDADEDEDEDVAPVVDEPAPAPVVSNPPTGNAPVALAVIPVALAAAAIVAKKRG